MNGMYFEPDLFSHRSIHMTSICKIKIKKYTDVVSRTGSLSVKGSTFVCHLQLNSYYEYEDHELYEDQMLALGGPARFYLLLVNHGSNKPHCAMQGKLISTYISLPLSITSIIATMLAGLLLQKSRWDPSESATDAGPTVDATLDPANGYISKHQLTFKIFLEVRTHE